MKRQLCARTAERQKFVMSALWAL